jgi:hypothetical protein
MTTAIHHIRCRKLLLLVRSVLWLLLLLLLLVRHANYDGLE